MLAAVANNGAILLGNNFAVDSYYKRLVRVVTHAHEDHTKYLSSSIRDSIYIVATPVTHEMLKLLGYSIPESKALKLDYYKGVEIAGERVTLLPSRHIAGSAQVLVEARDGTAGYTGDFKMPGTPPLKDLDVLVLDATYGSPHLDRKGTEFDAISALLRLIEEKGRDEPIWIYGYNGKLQEIMVELRIRGVKNRFLADPVTLKMAQIASGFYGMELGDVGIYTNDEVGPGVVIFMHVSKSSYATRSRGVHVILTGLERRGVMVEERKNLYKLAFSDHASFREIVEYVNEAKPKEVIVDGTRGFAAEFAAKYLSKVLGLRARVEPPNLRQGGKAVEQP